MLLSTRHYHFTRIPRTTKHLYIVKSNLFQLYYFYILIDTQCLSRNYLKDTTDLTERTCLCLVRLRGLCDQLVLCCVCWRQIRLGLPHPNRPSWLTGSSSCACNPKPPSGSDDGSRVEATTVFTHNLLFCSVYG